MKTNNITDYINLPYTIILKKDDEGDFVARIDELQGCVAHGKNEAEALQRLKGVQALWIEDCLDAQEPVPLPAVETALPSGKWIQRVARSLHKELTEDAKREAVSLNQLVATVLAHYVGNKKAVRRGLTDCLFVSHTNANEVTKAMTIGHRDYIWHNQGDWQVDGIGPYTGVTRQITGIQQLLPPKSHQYSYDYNAKKEDRYQFA